MVRITTDSTADLGPDLSTRFSIDTIPLIVTINEQEYRDGVTIHPSQLFEMVAHHGELPMTSAPSVADFTDFFSVPEETVHITISSMLSCSYQNACLAVDTISGHRIHVIDSHNLSTGIGLLVLKAAELRDQGCTAEEINTQILSLVPRVRTAFIVDSLDYLYKGGRCSALQSVMGSLLKIRPVIEMKADGSLGVRSKIRGARNKALHSLIAKLENDLPDLNRSRVFITHTGCLGDAKELAIQIQHLANPHEIMITDAGAVVSSHCGPGTIGVLYL